MRPLFFRGLSPSDVAQIVAVARHRRWRPDSIIYNEGEKAGRFYLLTGGIGRHFVISKDGRQVLLQWIAPGQTFGVPAMLDEPAEYLAGAEFVLEESCALMWDRKTLRDLVRRFPILLDNALLTSWMDNICWLITHQVSLLTNDARARIAHVLVSLAGGVGRFVAGGIEVPTNNEWLSARASASLYTVSRQLSEWQRSGILTRTGRGRIVLHKVGALAAL